MIKNRNDSIDNNDGTKLGGGTDEQKCSSWSPIRVTVNLIFIFFNDNNLLKNLELLLRYM